MFDKYFLPDQANIEKLFNLHRVTFPNENSSFELYEDDGTGLQYQQGDFAITKITSIISLNILSVTIQKPLGKFNAPIHSYVAKINLQKVPAAIKENGDEVDMKCCKNTTAKEWKITLN
jgi:hypothetical protein